MGLFSWLFGKKKTRNASVEAPQRHFCEDKPAKEKAPRNRDNNLANSQIEIMDIITDINLDELAIAEAIASDRESVNVKLKGYRGEFLIKKSKDDRYVFTLIARNGKVIAVSQIYEAPKNALIGINSVITNAPIANMEDQTIKDYTELSFPKWEIYIDREGKFRFRLRATNGLCILHSQGYTQKSSCKGGIESVIKHAGTAKIEKKYLEEER